MAISNEERVGKALELLKAGLRPFVERELKAQYGDRWASEVNDILGDMARPMAQGKHGLGSKTVQRISAELADEAGAVQG